MYVLSVIYGPYTLRYTEFFYIYIKDTRFEFGAGFRN